MTGRERLQRILNRQPVDRLSWTTLVDDRTRSCMSESMRRLHPFEFYRRLGCDLVQFGNYGLPAEDCVPQPFRTRMPEVQTETHTAADGTETRTRTTQWGVLTGTSRNGHPLAYPVGTPDALRILCRIWESAEVDEADGHEDALARTASRIGEAGLYVPTTAPSPVQHLLEYEMGVQNFYALLQDHPREMQHLLDAMHAVRCKEYRILARRTPAQAVIPVENTSSTLISPRLYRELSLPQIRDYADILHEHGKKIVLHMCGHLKALLPVLSETQMDASNATTPPPVGTVSFEDVLDAWGEDFVIFGGCYDSAVLQTASVSADGIRSYLDALYTPRIRQANLVGWVVADGLPTPLWIFEAIAEWMQKQAV